MELTLDSRPKPDLEPLTTVMTRVSRLSLSDGPVLSVYVDTTPARIANQAFLLALRDGFKATRATLVPNDGPRFEAAALEAERFVMTHEPFTHPGLVVFVIPAQQMCLAGALPRSPVEHTTWSAQPDVEPLEQMVDDSERLAVVLFDHRRARIFTFYLGEIETRQDLLDDVPGRTAVGGWYGLAQARLARHREDHVLRHVRHTINALLDLERAYHFDRLLLAGPEEAVAMLRRYLPRRLRLRTTVTSQLAVSASEAAVAQWMRREADELERREEQEIVHELLDAPTSRVVIGPDATLAVLDLGQVHLLVISDLLKGTAGRCATCDRLVVGANACPVCGAPLEERGDMRNLALRRAAMRGAKVEIVSGPAAAQLQERGGIGAWTRM